MAITIDGTNGITLPDGSASAPILNNESDTNNGIFFPTTDVTAITTAGTERMRVDASGNVGIGTTSPISGSVLDVASGTTTYPRVRSTIGSAAALFFQNSDTGTTTSDGMYVGITGAEEGVIWNNENTDLRIATNNTERARITSGGDLQFNSGYGSVATAYGCRAWVNFNGTGTVAIRASGNVTSITDNNTGDYTVNFTNAMPDANYGVICTGQRDSTGNGSAIAAIYGNATYGNSVTTTSVRVQLTNDAGNANDPISYHVAIFR